MADYDLGTAHGKIKIDYDGKGAKKARDDFDATGNKAESMGSRFLRFGRQFRGFTSDFNNNVSSMVVKLGLLAGASAMMAGMSRNVSTLGSSLLALRGSITIVSSLAIALGKIPAAMEDFPEIIKQIVRLSAVIDLLVGSLTLLGSVAGKLFTFSALSGIFNAIGRSMSGVAKGGALLLFGAIQQIGRGLLRFETVQRGAARVMLLATGVMTRYGNRIVNFVAPSLGLLTKHSLALKATMLATLGPFGLVGVRLLKMAEDAGGAEVVFRRLAETIRGYSGPIRTIARLAITVAALRYGVRTAFALAKVLGLVSAAAGALHGAVVLVAGLVNALSHLSGVVGLLPGGIFALVAAGATLAIGLKGIGDGFKAIGKSPEEFEEAIKDLAPAAKDFLRTLREFAPEFSRLQKAVQQRLFAGMAAEVRGLANIYLPVLNVGLGQIADSLNRAAKEITAFLKDPGTIRDMAEGFSLTSQIVDKLALGFQPLLRALRDVGVIGMQALNDLTGGFGPLMERFSAFVAQARADGSLRAWIDRGIEAVRDLWNILTSIASIFGSIFSAFETHGGSALQAIRSLTEELAVFFKSIEGQQALSAFAQVVITLSQVFRDVLLTALREFGPVIAAISPFVVDLAQAFGSTLITAIKIVAPLLRTVAEVLDFLSPVIVPLLGLLLGLGFAFKIVGGILSGIWGVLTLAATGFTVLRTVITTVMWAFRALTVTMLANPFVAIAAAILALAILIYLNWDRIQAFLIAAWNFIKNSAVAIWNGLVAFFTTLPGRIMSVLQAIPDFIGNMVSNIISFFDTLPERVGYAIGYMVGTVIRHVTEMVTAVIGFFTALPGQIDAFVKALVTNVINLFTDLNKRTVSSTADLFWGVVNWFQQLPGRVVSFVTDMFWRSVGFFERLPGTLSGYAENAIENITNHFRQLPGRVAGFIGDMVSAGVDLVKGLIRGILSMARAVWQSAVDLVKGAIRGARDAMSSGSPSRVFADIGSKELGQGFINGILSKRNEVVDAMRSIVVAMQDAIDKMPDPEIDISATLDKARAILAKIRSEAGKLTPGPAVATAATAVDRKSRNAGKPGYVQAEDGSWVHRDSFYHGAAPPPASGRGDDTRAQARAAAERAITVTFGDIINPVPEPASDTAARKLRTLAMMGRF
jgi:phage-related protein